MFTVRWITGEYDRTHTRDVSYSTKREALEAIKATKVSTVRKLGRTYCVQVAK